MSIGIATRGIISGSTGQAGTVVITETIYVAHSVSPESESIDIPVITVIDPTVSIVAPDYNSVPVSPNRRSKIDTLPSRSKDYLLPNV